MKGAAIWLLLATACSFSGAPGQPADAGDGGDDASGDAPDGAARGNRVSCDPLPTPGVGVTIVSDIAELREALLAAEPNETIALAPGDYDLGVDGPIILSVDGLTLRSTTGIAADVRLIGDPSLVRVIEVRGSDITVAAMTLRSSQAAISVDAPAGLTSSGVRLFDLTIEDFVSIGVEVLSSTAEERFNNDGLLACSRISQPSLVPAGPCVGFTVGVDLRGPSNGWRISENEIGPVCQVAATAVHFGVRVSRRARFSVIDHNHVIGFRAGVESGIEVPPARACDGAEGLGWDAYQSVVCANAVSYSNGGNGTSPARGITFRNSCDSVAAYNTIAWATGPDDGLRFLDDGSEVDHANNVITADVSDEQTSAPTITGPELMNLTAGDFRNFPTDLRLFVEPTTATDLSHIPFIEEYCSWDLDGFERDPKNPGFGAYAPTGSRLPAE